MKKLKKLVTPSFQSVEAFAVCESSCFCGCQCYCAKCPGLSSQKDLDTTNTSGASGTGSTVASGKYNQMMWT